MKFIIVFISLIAIASSSSSSEEETTESFTMKLKEISLQVAEIAVIKPFSIENEPKLKLQEIYNNYYEVKDKNDRKFGYPVSDAAKRECVKERMNLSAIGEKIVPKYSGNQLIKLSEILCRKDNDEKYRIIYEDLQEFSHIDDKVTKIFCIRRKIKELNGADKLEIEECKEVNEACERVIRILERENKRLKDMGIDECVNLNTNDFNSKLLEIILLKFEVNDEAYKNARKANLKVLKDLAKKTHECLLNKFNE